MQISQTKTLKFLAATIILLLALATPALATDISIFIDGTRLKTDVPPILENDHTLVPFRACAEALNAQVDYADGIITMTKGDKTVRLTIDSRIAHINGEMYALEAAAKIKNNRTLVPLRFVGEALNSQVKWNGSNNTISIYTSGTTPPITPNPPTTTDTSSNQEMVNALLKSCNELRSKKGLPSLTTSAEYTNFATKHSKDMAANSFVSSNSPSKGSLAKRSQNANLTAAGENVCKINLATDSSITQCINAWLKDDTARANLLHPSARYIGIGISADANDPALFYVAVEFVESDAYFTMPLNNNINTNKVTLTGCSLNSTDKITIYRLSDTNSNIYLDKQSVGVTPSNGKFSQEITFWSAGSYIVTIGNSSIKIKYK